MLTTTLKKMNLSSKKGFTLIELLVVIAIIGILAVVLLLAINPGQKINASRNARVKSDLEGIGKNAALFSVDTGQSASGYSAFPKTWGNKLGGYTFMSAIKDPSGNDYTYNVGPSTCTNEAGKPSTACTSVAIAGPVYDDGLVTTPGTLKAWCWQSKTGTITQVTDATAANCAP